MLRPQMKQQKERKKMLENLKKGDKVITSGGIYGTIAGFKGNNSIVILDIDKNVTITAINIPKIPKKLPCLEVSGDDSPRKAKMNRTPEIK